MKFLYENPDVGMVYGDCNFINENGRVIGKFNSAQTDARLLRQGYVAIPQQTAFFRADLWRQVGFRSTRHFISRWTTICGRLAG
ncbi:MAG: hypothetical protein U0X93_05880 [Anaerolineales bacterium]